MNVFKKNKAQNSAAQPQNLNFIKTNTNTAKKRILTAEQKTKLIKKGNMLLHGGDIDTAHKIFRALQFYDGLMRVSKTYYQNGQCTQAYIAACQAGAHRDVKSLGKAIAAALRVWINPINTANTTQRSHITKYQNNAHEKNIQTPDPQNIAKILALAKASKHINYN